MKINDNAVLKTSKEIEVYAPIDAVWNIQADIKSWANWQPDISEVKLSGLIEPGTKFEWKSGGFKLHSALEEVIENKIIVGVVQVLAHQQFMCGNLSL